MIFYTMLVEYMQYLKLEIAQLRSSLNAIAHRKMYEPLIQEHFKEDVPEPVVMPEKPMDFRMVSVHTITGILDTGASFGTSGILNDLLLHGLFLRFH